MDSVDKLLQRVDLRQIRSFLLYGSENFSECIRPYKDNLRKESAPIYKRLEKLCPDENELDQAIGDLSMALTAYEYVYMELGIKAGARLIYQLLLIDN